MTDEKVDLHRDYYPLAEAAKIAKRSIDDFIYEASIGNIHLYVIADDWKVGKMDSLTSGVKLPKPMHIKYIGPQPPELPDVRDPKFSEILAERTEKLEQCDQVLGGYTSYGRRGQAKPVYDTPLTGCKPIAKKSFENYRINRAKAIVEIDGNVLLKLKDTVQEQITIRPELDMLVHKALRKNIIVIMVDDLKDILGQSGDVSLRDLRKHPHWPSELGIAIDTWLELRDSIPKNKKPNAFMQEWLHKKYSERELSDEAVIRIATVANWDKKGGPKKTDGE